MKNLDYYISCFKKLKRAPNLGGAPHKPILLLSVIDCYNAGYIDSEKIYITAELMAYFKSNWQAYVTTGHTMNFALPFFHMSREPFWKLVEKIGCNIELTSKKSIKSFNALYTAINYAEIDNELVVLMMDIKSREYLRNALMQEYFPQSTLQKTGTYYLDSIAKDILNESGTVYRKKLAGMSRSMDEEEYEEEIFLRGSVFKQYIPKIYNQTCCVTGYKMSSICNISMIDACHIVPFSKSHDDTIGNGLSLCPNIHRAFDRGLITIDEDFKIVISNNFEEDCNNPFSLKQFENKKILLPSNLSYIPQRENLLWHNENVFKTNQSI
jgi:putative restriction endonuclease